MLKQACKHVGTFFFKKWKPLILVFSIGLTIVVLSLYFFNFHGPLSSNSDHWSNFGEFFGGTIGTVLNFISLIVVILIYDNQRKELKTSENVDIFFKLLDVFNHLVMSTRVKFAIVGNREGNSVYSRLMFVFLNNFIRPMKKRGLDEKNVKNEYEKFYSKYQNVLGHYFRTFYNIVKFIDNSNMADSTKKELIQFLKSCLSSAQLKLLFLNCLFGQGEKKFKPYVEKYGLLNNLQWENTLFDLFKEKFDKSAYEN